jgi:hypothetical protein
MQLDSVNDATEVRCFVSCNCTSLTVATHILLGVTTPVDCLSKSYKVHAAAAAVTATVPHCYCSHTATTGQ